MEDSYTVHRRRKAAASARRREKTPEAPRHPVEDEINDEEAETRARMEKMVEDTERMEAMASDIQIINTNEKIDIVSDDKEILTEMPKVETDKTLPVDEPTNEMIDIELKYDKIEPVRRARDPSKKRIKRSQERWSSSCSSADEDKSSRSGAKSERNERKREKKPSRRLRKESARRSEVNDHTLDSSKYPSSKEPVVPPRTSKSSHSRERSRSEGPQHANNQIEEVSHDNMQKKYSHEESSADRLNKSSLNSDKASRSSKMNLSNQSENVVPPPLTRATKQIIPLSNDSLIHDLQIAQKKYEIQEIGILDAEEYVNPKMETALRRRKRHKSKIETKDIPPDEAPVVTQNSKSWWFWSWLIFFKSTKKKDEGNVEDDVINTKDEVGGLPTQGQINENGQIMRSFKLLILLSDIRAEFQLYARQNLQEIDILKKLRNRCIAEIILMIIYCGLGAFVFRFTEGAFENFYKCGVKRVKRDFLDSLWNYSHNLREDDWKSMARKKLMEFEEQLYQAYDAGLHTYSGQRTWTFLNAFVYCLTVVTTIGYGHIYPTTATGQAITIIYAIFGIPMFLIILADFGKLFTRGMKFLWAFVRRLYYTGSCRRVRRTAPVQEVMKGVQMVYDLATFRRPSQMNPDEIAAVSQQQNVTQTVLNVDGNIAQPDTPHTPDTPAMSTFAIDDEFNLPISVAITLLLAYIFVGATAYNIWEDWNFFQSFYFVFISMSTIGFGDFVPKHPIYMMCSIVYLVFGLALTSMCINVVQVMLSDSFKQASQKIGATIGFEVAVDDGSIQTTAPPAVEIADVHATIKEDEEPQEIMESPNSKEGEVSA